MDEPVTGVDRVVLAAIAAADTPVENAIEIGRICGLPLAEVSAIVDRLRAHGLICWVPGPQLTGEHKSAHWKLTPLGAEALVS